MFETRCRKLKKHKKVRTFTFDEIEKHKNIGLTAGASAPDILIQEFIGKMHELYDVEIKNISVANENITFKIPKELNE